MDLLPIKKKKKKHALLEDQSNERRKQQQQHLFGNMPFHEDDVEIHNYNKCQNGRIKILYSPLIYRVVSSGVSLASCTFRMIFVST